MTDTALRGLVERVRTAVGPDRELDEAILRALDDEFNVITRYYDTVIGWDTINDLSGRTYAHPAPLTASADAALALVERMLPGWGVTIVTDPPSCSMRPSSAADHEHFKRTGYFLEAREIIDGATPALAILAALLAALIAQAEQ